MSPAGFRGPRFSPPLAVQSFALQHEALASQVIAAPGRPNRKLFSLSSRSSARLNSRHFKTTQPIASDHVISAVISIGVLFIAKRPSECGEQHSLVNRLVKRCDCAGLACFPLRTLIVARAHQN